MAQPKEFKTNRWLWALATAGISLIAGLAPVLPPKGAELYLFNDWILMLREGFSLEGLVNGIILSLFAVVISLPIGWILQAVIVVIWNTAASHDQNPQNSN
jgi:hypothetical protein